MALTPHGLTPDAQGVYHARYTTAQRTALTPAQAGLVVYDTDLGSPFYWTGTEWLWADAEWEQTDGGGEIVRTLTDPLRRAGTVGTQDYFTDSDGGTPAVAAASIFHRYLMAKPDGSASGYGQYWNYPESVLCRGIIGDGSVEANAVNTTGGISEWPVVGQGFVWQIFLAATSNPRTGGAPTSCDYLIEYIGTNVAQTVLASWTVTMTGASLVPAVDLRTNVGAAGETLSTQIITPGNAFRVTMTNPGATVDFPKGLTLTVIGGLARRGN